MFGLKIIKSGEYNDLQEKVKFLTSLLETKDLQISELKGKINGFENSIGELRKELNSLKTDSTAPKTVLLTDVAEKPLSVETAQKSRKVVRKTGNSTTTHKTVKKVVK